MELNKIKKVKLHSEVVKILEDYIRSNNLKPNDPLPSERVLAEKIGVGRSSLREAIRVLEAQGIVEVVSGKGIFVGPSNAVTDAYEYLSKKLKKKVTLLELYQIRRPLGALSVELAALNATEKQIEDIGKSLDAYEKSVQQGQDGWKYDRAFHLGIERSSGNAIIPKLFEFIYQQWDSFEFEAETAYPESCSLHRPIYEAIRKRDSKAAGRAFHKLMDYVEKLIVKQENQ